MMQRNINLGHPDGNRVISWSSDLKIFFMKLQIVVFLILTSMSALPKRHQTDVFNETKSMETIKQALMKETGKDWKIEDYGFGKLLCGSVKFANSSKRWNTAGFFICNKNIPDVLKKLVDLGMQAPFKILDYSKHYQIISWAGKCDRVNKVIDIIKNLDN